MVAKNTFACGEARICIPSSACNINRKRNELNLIDKSENFTEKITRIKLHVLINFYVIVDWCITCQTCKPLQLIIILVIIFILITVVILVI
jgi:thiol:disulfide interchange protein